ncbi:hypothetical protein GOP47_0029616 [Adiantum capillus-veneris]|nr:hypothetical protein GOP47_0029221 [Adiantum capillus-veneris]KAI5056095.1 hypothetical protein GOP47_0029616 [Adiantum capillus-veneris]
MDTSGFVTSLLTSLIIFVVLYLLHAWLSRKPGNAVVYYPSKLLKNIPPPTNRGIFSWIGEAWSATEEQILLHAGLDATVYMIFLSSAFWVCLYTALFCVPVLLPLSGTDDNFEEQARLNPGGFNFTDFDKVAMGNVTNKSSRLWAFAIADYWLTIATMYVLWKSYKHVVHLRTQDQSAPKAKPQQYAVLVRDIPPPSTGSISEEVDTFFKTLHPTTYETCIIVTNMAKASKVWSELETCRRKLAHAEAVLEVSKKRPMHKTGKFGLYGPKVDSIDYYREQMEKLAPLLKDEQGLAHSKSQQGAAIAIFSSRASATSASQVMHSEYANAWTTMAAPEPREVVWGNLPIPFVQRLVRQFVVYGIVFLTVLFYMIPITFISAIIALDNLEKKLTFLKPIIEIPAIKTILQAFLPQLALIIFLALLPMLLLKLSQAEGIPGQSHVVRAAAGKYFYFNVFNVFLGVTIAGSLLNSLNDFLNDPSSIVELLSKSLPLQATFFISFVALKFFVGYGLQLSRIVPLIIFHLKRKYLCKTDEEIRDAWAPGSFNYATCVPADMLVLTITVCYSVLAPAILPFAIIYFGLGWLLMRNQALNVVVPRFESGGRMWPHIHSRILAALFLAQLTIFGYFGLKKFVYAPLLIFPIIATLVFAFICRKFFYPSFNVSPLSAACKEVKEVPSTESIVEAYTPECLASRDSTKAKSSDPEKQDDV